MNENWNNSSAVTTNGEERFFWKQEREWEWVESNDNRKRLITEGVNEQKQLEDLTWTDWLIEVRLKNRAI